MLPTLPVAFCLVLPRELFLCPILGKHLFAVRITMVMASGAFAGIPIKKKPESLIAINWPLYFESWDHKPSVLKEPLKAFYLVSWIYKAWISFIILMSSSLLAYT